MHDVQRSTQEKPILTSDQLEGMENRTESKQKALQFAWNWGLSKNGVTGYSEAGKIPGFFAIYIRFFAGVVIEN